MIKQLFLGFFIIGFFTTTPKIDTVRNLYKKSYSSKENVQKFYEELKEVKKNDKAILVGYKAASIILKSKYTKGIKNKKILFKKGKNILENKIKEYPKNIELRLIRLSIQENVPKILKYKKNIIEDKNFIQKNLKTIKDKNLKNYIMSFISKSKSFSKGK